MPSVLQWSRHPWRDDPSRHHHPQPASRPAPTSGPAKARRESTRLRATVSLLLLAACAGTPESSDSSAALASAEALLPDTATVDGVLVMRHGADAFERAPQYTIDSVPEVMFDGGDDPDFDLTNVLRPALLSNGRAVAAFVRGRGRVLLFKPDGTPDRVLAPWGQGPGDVMSPLDPLILPGDTIVIIDGGHRRVSWFSADSGVLQSELLAEGIVPFCDRPSGQLDNGRILTVNVCIAQGVIDSAVRPPIAVRTVNLRYDDPDTVAVVPGTEMVPFETRYRGRRDVQALPLRFGRRSLAAAWGGEVAVSTGELGHTIERYDLNGVLRARWVIDRPRAVVTAAMREAEVAHELARIEGPQMEAMVDAEESKRQAREAPFADSLPPYQALLSGHDGDLWAIDPQTRADSGWSATIVRRDGPIRGRVFVRGRSMPVWVGADRVMLREIDADGVVRFGVYRMAAAPLPAAGTPEQ